MTKRDARLHRLGKQAARFQQRLARLQRQSEMLSRVRLIFFTLGGIVSTAVFLTHGVDFWIPATLLGFVPFIAAVVMHRRLESALLRTEIWLQGKQAQQARMRLDWDALPAALAAPDGLDHPFALDLDLVGPRSLHHLLNTAVTPHGSKRLQTWLLAQNAELAHIRQRQARVQALLERPLFRQRLALYVRLLLTAHDGWPAEKIAEWVKQPVNLQGMRRKLLLLAGMAGLMAIFFVLLFTGQITVNTVLPIWTIYLLSTFVLSVRQTRRSFEEAAMLQEGLLALKPLFDFLERSPHVKRPFIREICAPFLDAQKRPSARLRQLRGVFAGIGISQNVLLGITLNLLVPWDLFFTYQLRRRQAVLADELPQWLDAVYELEALASLAGLAGLDPDNVTFPQVEEAAAERPLLAATGVGHPLIAAPQRVTNDFIVPGVGSITIITGSNMAGKSSFLRAVGINLVLAYAGGPVLAHSFTAARLRLFTSIRVTDSVTEGFSYFYAEVRRLQALLTAVEMAAERPLFFLIDEIFRGTNNRERLIGSRAYIRALAGSRSAGLVATHDLELVKLAEEHNGIRNMHFRDDVQNGKMIFDYTLRSGPCPTTNALKIMRLAGLPVETDTVKRKT